MLQNYMDNVAHNGTGESLHQNNVARNTGLTDALVVA